ncbi:hypothetical protein K2224_37785 (plasmid) [Streptomyces sp. BHT-5-2]|uniref:NAD(P)-binding domain-containing protein n=1 Tax=unclassified Streptomyces TaxID=2593676 RepID=UPI001C8E570E|nr:NAD(P)-binding domain-containing protein [Streptomyces sp. BHT-5-2]QZL08784.1 hypothetical protein K2224_37785 [Streptomyces sp. BHT-5-2]
MAGYGVITSGIIRQLLHSGEMSVSLLSRHLTTPPHPGVRLVTEAEVPASRPDVILGCFEDDVRSREFWTSPSTTAATVASGAGCIEMSTLSPAWIDEWHIRIRGSGGVSVECPVTGSRSGAANGTLSAFLYRSADDPRSEQVLRACTRQRYTFRTSGHPTRFKLVYNAWGAALLHSLKAFVPTLRAALGEDFDVAGEIVKSNGWMSLVCASKLDRMVEERFDDPDFALRHMVKDLRYAHDVIGDSNDLLDLVYRSYVQAESIHGGAADYTAVTGPGEQ